MSLSIKNGFLPLKLFYKKGNYALAAFKKILIVKGYEKKKDCGQMLSKVLKKIIKKFEKTDSFDVKSGKRRKSIALIQVEDVITALQEGMKSNVRIFHARGIV